MGLLTTWLTGLLAYGADLAAPFAGQFTLPAAIAWIGVLFLVSGVSLAVTEKVPQAWRMLVVGLIASTAPIVVTIANQILGWVGMLFAVLFGLILMLVGTWTVSIIADRRLPVWLLGLFATALLICAAESAGAFVALGV